MVLMKLPGRFLRLFCILIFLIIANSAKAEIQAVPVLQNDTVSGPEDVLLVVHVMLNDFDADGDLDPGSLTVIGSPANGIAVVNPGGTINYTPNPNFFGIDSLTYRLCDSTGSCDTALVIITVLPSHDPPQPLDDVDTLLEDSFDVIAVLSNDVDPDNNLDPGSVVVVTGPSNGNASVNPLNGDITYTPNANFFGNDQLIYRVFDSTGLSSTAILFLYVDGTPDAPTAVDDHVLCMEDTPTIWNLALNDFDVDNNLNYPSLSILTPPIHGGISVDPFTGFVSYVPDTNYFGPDQFTYIICDYTALCDTATVFVTVVDMDDAPIAVNDTVVTVEDSTATAFPLFNDIDVDGDIDSSSLSIVMPVANGTTVINPVNHSIFYTPDTNYWGYDQLIYQICDSSGLCSQALLVFYVSPTDDVPEANDDQISTNEDTPVTAFILSNDIDPDGDLDYGSLLIINGPQNGVVLVMGSQGRINYTPNTNWHGTDSLTYQVCDSAGNCDTANVYIYIHALSDPPIAYDDSASTNEDVPVIIDVLVNDVDIDGDIDPGSLTVIGSPMHGIVWIDPFTHTITYFPDLNYNGPDQVQYQICDSVGFCSFANVFITIHSIPDGPQANVDFDATPPDSTIISPLLFNDWDPDNDIDRGSVTIITPPSHGTLSPVLPLGSMSYTPSPGYTGMDSYIYQVCDSTAVCDTAIVILSVSADAPIAINDTILTPEDITIDIDVLNNDFDPNGNLLPNPITISSGPYHGSAIVNTAFNMITYTPDTNFFGPDSIQYYICDQTGYCDQAIAYIIVDPRNDWPVAQDDAFSLWEDDSTTYDILANDIDNDGNLDPSSVTIITSVVHGLLSVDPFTGIIKYVPDSNYFGPDFFIYQVCDSVGQCDMATVYITVNPVNDPIIAIDDFGITPEDTPINIDILLNDIDVDGDMNPSSVTILNGPFHGSLIIDPITGAASYSPDFHFVGFDFFIYEVCDTSGYCDQATVTISVNSQLDPPEAIPDYATTPEDVAVTINVALNDIDDDGNLDPSSITIIVPPFNGYATPNSNGTVTYWNFPNYWGWDEFVYQICDSAGLCDTALVQVYINPQWDIPIANDDVDSTLEDTPVDIRVTLNDIDLDGDLDSGSVVIINVPLHGTAIVGPTGLITYTPNSNFSGVDVFSYEVCDSVGLCDQASVTVYVDPLNDPPVAVNDTLLLQEDIPLNVNLAVNDFDPDGNLNPAGISITQQPTNATVYIDPLTGFVTITPAPNYVGPDQMIYRICDLDGLCDTALVIWNVISMPDPPFAVNDTSYTQQDTAVITLVLSNDSDPEGDIDPGSVVVISGPSHGMAYVDSVTGNIVYVPDSAYFGMDQYIYQVCDSTGLCDIATVTIYIGNTSDAPIAWTDIVNLPEDSTYNILVLINDTDPDNDIDPGSVSIFLGPVHGTAIPDPLNGTIEYIPDPNYFGLDSLIYEICDSTNLCDTAWIYIFVSPVEDPPLAVPDIAATPEDTSVSIPVLANDSDPENNIDTSSLLIITHPQNGSLSIDTINWEIIYTPDSNYFGGDQFIYQICDSTGLCDTAIVIISIDATVDPPIAWPDTLNIWEDGSGILPVVDNDTDPDGNLDPGSVTVIYGPNNGQITIDPLTGAISYVPDTNFNGLDTLIYQICDSTALCDTALVVFDVWPVNDAPVAIDDSVETIAEMPIEIIVLANDYDVDGHPLTVGICGIPQHGTISLNWNYTFTYTPDTGYLGPDSFCYYICDNQSPALCDTAIVYINVIEDSLNEPPVAVIDYDTCIVNDYIDIIVLDNDYDPNGDPLTIGICGNPSHGIVIVNAFNTITYIPEPDFIGLDTFCYYICDNGIPPLCDSALVIVAVIDTSEEIIEFRIPEAFSPNGDGFNDKFVIPTIEDYPENEFVVYNRWGNEVYRKKGYLNEWDGKSQGPMTVGDPLPTGTYYYILILGDGSDPFRGSIYITR